jgi:SAM-dependent methyltransferase
MSSIESNLSFWNEHYNWKQGGDEWSAGWGGTAMMWYGTLMPRIHRFLPVDTILELAPGFGRLTKYLRNYCQKLIGVDLAPKCIEHCKNIFADDNRLSFFQNDGRSLDMIPDESSDFVFSYDSFVHVERSDVVAYLQQIPRKMKRDGVCFIHHSNLGEYADWLSEIAKVADNLDTDELRCRRTIDEDTHWRAPSMTAAIFKEEAEKAGLKIACQEKINWCTAPEHCIDCFSVCIRADSPMTSSGTLLQNGRFTEEMNRLRALEEAYHRGQ